MFTTPRPRGPGRQLSPDQGAKLVMLAPILLNRLLMLLPSNVAPPAIASAMKMISIAYSVAVAPRSSLQKRLNRASMCIPRRLSPWPTPLPLGGTDAVDQPRPKRLIFAVRFGLGRLTGTYVSNFVWFATEN